MCAAPREHSLTRVASVCLMLVWCLLEPAASQVPAECGSPESGALNAGESCEGYYVGADAGFETQCGDGKARAGGCELAVDAAFERHDADHDGAIGAQEAQGMFAAIGIDVEAMGGKFEHVDSNHDGKMTMDEWLSAGNTHPTIAMRVRAGDAFDKSFPIESADFGMQFRKTAGAAYSGSLSLADPIDACEPLSGHYSNRVVLAKRGVCEFCVKAKEAQAAGAQAIMVANNDESLIHMTVGTCGNDVTIPSIMVPHSVGEEFELARYTAASVMFPTCRSGSPLKPGTCTLPSFTFAKPVSLGRGIGHGSW